MKSTIGLLAALVLYAATGWRNLDEDLEEKHNRAAGQREKVAALQSGLAAWASAVHGAGMREAKRR